MSTIARLEALAASEPALVPYQRELVDVLQNDILQRQFVGQQARVLCRALILGGPPPSLLAHAVAPILHGERRAVLRIEDALDPRRTPTQSLLGPVPGFLGPPGRLYEFLREHPDGLVVVDDLLALPPVVIELLANVCELGSFVDQLGRRVDARSAVIFVRAGIGREVASALEAFDMRSLTDFGAQMSEQCMRLYPEHLSPWVWGRLRRSIQGHLWSVYERGGISALTGLLPETAARPDPLRWRPLVTDVDETAAKIPIVPIRRDVGEYEVFLSYRSSAHAHAAVLIHDELSRRGVRCWFDRAVLQRKDEERYDRHELAAALIDAVHRARCSVVFEVGLEAAELPPGMSWKYAIDRKLVMHTDAGLVFWNWQRLEMGASNRLLAIDHAGGRAYAVEGQPPREQWSKTFSDDKELVEIVCDYVAGASSRPRDPIVPHTGLSTQYLVGLLGSDFDAGLHIVREILGHEGLHPGAEGALHAISHYDSTSGEIESLIEVLDDSERVFGGSYAHSCALEGQLRRTEPIPEQQYRLLEIAERVIATRPADHLEPLWVYARGEGGAVRDRLFDAILDRTSDVRALVVLAKEQEDFSPSTFDDRFIAFWRAGMRIDAAAFERDLVTLGWVRADSTRRRGLHPDALCARLESIDPPPQHALLRVLERVRAGAAPRDAVRIEFEAGR